MWDKSESIMNPGSVSSPVNLTYLAWTEAWVEGVGL
jgi:hypothetical protein